VFRFDSKDKTDIKSFPLFWRWDQNSGSDLSDEEVTLIEPLPKSKAFELHEKLMLEFKKLPERSRNLISSESPEVNKWLSESLSDDKFVFLSWDDSTAIRLPSSLFVIRNDDFCYPSSDDIFIYPESERYLLQFHHSEVFTCDQLIDI
jgi:hypothetical protein